MISKSATIHQCWETPSGFRARLKDERGRLQPDAVNVKELLQPGERVVQTNGQWGKAK